MKQVVLYVVMGAWLTVLLIGYPLMFLVTARRPADDRDAFIGKLPSPSQLPTVRVARLRMLVRQEIVKLAKIEAVLAAVIAILGLSTAANDQMPIGVGIAATAFMAVPMVVLYALFNGFYLLARYRSAQYRVHNDAYWHASGENPAAASNDAEHSSTP